MDLGQCPGLANEGREAGPSKLANLLLLMYIWSSPPYPCARCENWPAFVAPYCLLQRQANIRRRALTILDRVFPEYLTLFPRPFSPSSHALLRQAVTADAFAAWPPRLIWRIMRYRP